MSLEDLDSDVLDKLKERAWEESDPFCYSDYIVVTKDENGNAVCPRCGSDDLMRHVTGVGVEWGIEWVIEYIIKQEWEAVTDHELQEIAMDEVDEYYPAVKIGEVEYSCSQILKELDPIHLQQFESDIEERNKEDGNWVEIGSTIYVVPKDMK